MSRNIKLGLGCFSILKRLRSSWNRRQTEISSVSQTPVMYKFHVAKVDELECP